MTSPVNSETPPRKPLVLVVDDEPTILAAWRAALADHYRAVFFQDPMAAVEFATSTEDDIDVGVLDVRMPGMDGLTLMRLLHEAQPELEVVFASGFATISLAVDAMQLGAYYFLEKPIADLAHAMRVIAGAAERSQIRRGPTDSDHEDDQLVGGSRAMRDLRQRVQQLTRTTLPVLLRGEPGSGRTHVARSIHEGSARKAGPLVVFSCGAATSSRIEKEVFGTVDDAGLIDAAEGGTLVLEDIEQLPMPAQRRLLGVVEHNRLQPMGAPRSRVVDVRLIATSSEDLERMVGAYRFDEDLLARLTTFTLALTPLRERRSDILPTARALLARHASQLGRAPVELSFAVVDALCSHPWPGNLRELDQAMAHAVTVTPPGSEVGLEHLPAGSAWRVDRHRKQRDEQLTPGTLSSAPYGPTRIRVMDDFERRYLVDLLEGAEGNLSEASRRSGIDRTNLRRMCRRWGLVADSFRGK